MDDSSRISHLREQLANLREASMFSKAELAETFSESLLDELEHLHCCIEKIGRSADAPR